MRPSRQSIQPFALKLSSIMHEITGHKIIRDSPKPSSAGQRMLTEQCLIFHFIKREGNKEKNH